MTDLPHRKVAGKHGDRGFELQPEVLNRLDDASLFLRTRRSTVAMDITAPGPDEAQLDIIMQAACRVPDHGKLTPWRFVILRDAARNEYIEALSRIWHADNPDAQADATIPEVSLMRDTPVLVIVISSPVEHFKIPTWEQRLSAGACCLNLLNAAIAQGLAAQWRSGWPAYDERATRLLGLQPEERVAGIIHIGSRRADAPALQDRRRPDWRERTVFHLPSTAEDT